MLKATIRGQPLGDPIQPSFTANMQTSYKRTETVDPETKSIRQKNGVN